MTDIKYAEKFETPEDCQVIAVVGPTGRLCGSVAPDYHERANFGADCRYLYLTFEDLNLLKSWWESAWGKKLRETSPLDDPDKIWAALRLWDEGTECLVEGHADSLGYDYSDMGIYELSKTLLDLAESEEDFPDKSDLCDYLRHVISRIPH
jgi:hypothetical protein